MYYKAAVLTKCFQLGPPSRAVESQAVGVVASSSNKANSILKAGGLCSSNIRVSCVYVVSKSHGSGSEAKTRLKCFETGCCVRPAVLMTHWQTAACAGTAGPGVLYADISRAFGFHLGVTFGIFLGLSA